MSNNYLNSSYLVNKNLTVILVVHFERDILEEKEEWMDPFDSMWLKLLTIFVYIVEIGNPKNYFSNHHVTWLSFCVICQVLLWTSSGMHMNYASKLVMSPQRAQNALGEIIQTDNSTLSH